jgi:hypothetical protein
MLICSAREVARSRLATNATSPAKNMRRIGNVGETSMTALTLHTKRIVEITAPKLRTAYHWVLCVIDAIAEARMREDEHAINRSRQLLNHQHGMAAKPNRVRG